MRTPTCGRLSAAAAAAVEDVPAPMASLLSRLPEGGVMFNDVMKAIDECGWVRGSSRDRRRRWWRRECQPPPLGVKKKH